MTICSKGRFVICDGSGYDLSRDLKAVGTVDMRRLEVMTFENDLDQVRLKGKGYGEGQIIEYAIENSEFLASASSFAKCTGKLWIENYLPCRRAYNGTAGFSHFGFMAVSAVDTRFFIVQKEFFRSRLLGSYARCDDLRGKYLENAYFDSLRGTAPKEWILPVYPKIRGISGTSGQEISCGNLKQLGKTLAIHYLRSQE